MNKLIRVGLLLIAILLASGCDTGMRQLGPTETGVKFCKLPPWIGGGICGVKQAGELVVVFPWESFYVFDTRIRNLEWGATSSLSDKLREDYVRTRASDGNEVSLAVRVQYRVMNDPKMVRELIQHVGTSVAEVEEIVASAARSDIRTYMNELKTAEFFLNEAKYAGETRIKAAMEERLSPYGIEIVSVNLKEHRFENVLPDGTVDRRYQERINKVQALEQETERERLRKATVIADKRRLKSDMQARVNRRVEEAKGHRQQAQLKGDGYYEAKVNEAAAITAVGKAEVEGMEDQIAALAGPGGRAILRLEVARQLSDGNQSFVVVGQNDQSSLSVQKLDANDLLRQIGLIEVMAESAKSTPTNNETTEDKSLPVSVSKQ